VGTLYNNEGAGKNGKNRLEPGATKSRVGINSARLYVRRKLRHSIGEEQGVVEFG
jgi:hypothetical protein